MHAANSTPPCKVLVVDDSDDDRFILRRRLRRQPEYRIVAEVSDGEDAISYLRGDAIFADRATYPFPDLIFLDLKMPKVTGYDVLAWLQSQSDQLGDVKVVVLSGSFLPEDVAKSIELGAHAYHMKNPDKGDETAFFEKVKAVLDGNPPDMRFPSPKSAENDLP